MNHVAAELCIKWIVAAYGPTMLAFWRNVAKIKRLLRPDVRTIARRRQVEKQAMDLRARTLAMEKDIIQIRVALAGLMSANPRLDGPTRRAMAAINSNLNPLAYVYAPGERVCGPAYEPRHDLSLFFGASSRSWAFMPGYCVRHDYEESDCAPDDDFA